MVKGKHHGSSSGKANKPKSRQHDRKFSWHQCQCSGSSQIPSQDDLNNYHQFLSLYTVKRNYDRTELVIYNTENEKEEVKVLDYQIDLDESTSITQLPNGDLFCYGSKFSGITLIIDRNYRVRMQRSGTSCGCSSALYFDNSIYCFGGYNKNCNIALSRKFDLGMKKWINLTMLPVADACCHSVIFNGNILISGYRCKNLWLYSIEINSFSQIPYDFIHDKRKFMVNVGRLYLIEWDEGGLIYEGEDEYHWKPISKLRQPVEGNQTYCLYNKEKILIFTWLGYYQFDLKKMLLEIMWLND